jgi:hypothetical protein
MGEHMFDRQNPLDPRETLLGRAIELAERLPEEVCRARQDWQAVAAIAGELATLALRLDGLRSGDESPAK